MLTKPAFLLSSWWGATRRNGGLVRLFQEAFVEKPCLIYRRYLVGNPEYAYVNPAEAETHMSVCKAGCADFWRVVSTTGPAPVVPCYSIEELDAYQPEPGTIEFHMLACDACRCDHLDTPRPTLPQTEAEPRALVRPTDPRQHCYTPEELRKIDLDPGELPFHLLTCGNCRKVQMRLMAAALRKKFLAPSGSVKSLSRAG